MEIYIHLLHLTIGTEAKNATLGPLGPCIVFVFSQCTRITALTALTHHSPSVFLYTYCFVLL